MLKKHAKTLIIALIQFIFLALLAILVITQLVKAHDHFAVWEHFFTHYQPWFLLGHGFMYLGLYLLWPGLIRRLVNQSGHTIAKERVQKAIQSRNYLLGLLVLLEILFQVRG